MCRSFWCGIVAFLVSSARVGLGQVSYSITDLGSGQANAINNLGQVVGQNGNNDIFLYSNGAVQDLGNGDGLGINDASQIVGYYDFFNNSHFTAFLYTGGSFQTIGTNEYEAVGINNGGEVVGTYAYGTTAWTYLNGSLQNIGGGAASAINSSGQVVGGGSDGNAFLYSNGSRQFVAPYVTGHFASATAINSSGQVVGTYGAGIAFSYSNGSLQNLGSGAAYGINNSGQIVGTSGGSACIFSGGSTENLNNLISPASGWSLQRATAINNSGQIVGYGTNSSGQTHAFLLTPLPQAPLTYVPPPPEIPNPNPQPNQVIPDLAIYQNGTWNAVTAHSLGTDIHVLVHGWAPGQQSWVQTQLENNQPAQAWNDTSFFSGFNNLAQAIEAKDPGSSVVAYSWINLSATATLLGASTSEQWTDTAGDILAGELKEALPTNGLQDLQLFGQSHGARVATLATEKLANSGINVSHLTLADSPESSVSILGGAAYMANAENDLAPELKKLNLGRSAGETFVDNYISAFGTPYRNSSDPNLASLVDVNLQANSLDPIYAHGYPISWYANATSVPNTEDGLAWTPALGNAASSLASSYTQDWDNPQFPGQFLSQYETRLKGSDGSYLNNFPVTNLQRSMTVAETMSSSVEATPTTTVRALILNTLATTGTVSSTTNDVRLSENGNAIWTGSLNLLPGDQSLNFDYQFLSLGSGADLGIWVDNDLRFVLTGAVAGGDLQSSEFEISDYAPGLHTLSIALYTYGGGDAVVDVSNFNITSIPEPTSLVLFLLTLFVATNRRRFYAKWAFVRA